MGGKGVPLTHRGGLEVFEPCVKSEQEIDLREYGVEFPGIYFPCNTAEDALRVVENQPPYDLITFPGSRCTCYKSEANEYREFLRQILLKGVAPSERTKLFGVCFGFQLFAEVLVGNAEVGKVCGPNPCGYFAEYSLRAVTAVQSRAAFGKEHPLYADPPEMFTVHGDVVWATVNHEEGTCEPMPVAEEFRKSVGDELVVTHANPQMRVLCPDSVAGTSPDNEFNPHVWLEQEAEAAACQQEAKGNSSKGNMSSTTRWMASAFLSEKQNVFALQSHPELTAQDYYAIMRRCSEKSFVGFNGHPNMPRPKRDPKDGGFLFPVMSQGSEMALEGVRKLNAANMRAPGVATWLRGVLQKVLKK